MSRCDAICCVQFQTCGISRDGAIPWDLPAARRRFETLTEGQTVIMGRKTWEGLGGTPFPGRFNVVLSSTLKEAPEGCDLLAASLWEALLLVPTDRRAFVIGGKVPLEQALRSNICDKVYITIVRDESPVDLKLDVSRDDFDELLEPTCMEKIMDNGFETERAVLQRLPLNDDSPVF